MPERPKYSEELAAVAKECQEGSAEQCEKAFGLYQEHRHNEKFKASSKGCELGSAGLCEKRRVWHIFEVAASSRSRVPPLCFS